MQQSQEARYAKVDPYFEPSHAHKNQDSYVWVAKDDPVGLCHWKINKNPQSLQKIYHKIHAWWNHKQVELQVILFFSSLVKALRRKILTHSPMSTASRSFAGSSFHGSFHVGQYELHYLWPIGSLTGKLNQDSTFRVKQRIFIVLGWVQLSHVTMPNRSFQVRFTHKKRPHKLLQDIDTITYSILKVWEQESGENKGMEKTIE